MTLRPCERTWQIDALREGRLAVKDAESFERHSRSCSTCTATLVRDERLRALGAAFPAVEPPPLALRRVRGRILRDLSTHPQGDRRRLWGRLSVIAPALGVALLAVLHVLSRGVSDPRVETVVAAPLAASYAGSVSAGPGSAWKQTRDAQTERVELDEGTLRVHVRPQRPGERFLIVLPDGELEVRGTTFDVEVARGRTARVHVDEGVVELRLHDASVRTLAAGTAWAVETLEPASPKPSPAVSVTPPKVRIDRANDTDGGGAAYAEAIRLFRDGHYESAAGAFHAFAHSSPLAPEAEDASFLEAVALARSGRLDAAALAAERHLESYPRSFRAREASLLIARAASRRGDCGRARGVLAPWSSSPSSPRDSEVDAILRTCEGGAPLDSAR